MHGLITILTKFWWRLVGEMYNFLYLNFYPTCVFLNQMIFFIVLCHLYYVLRCMPWRASPLKCESAIQINNFSCILIIHQIRPWFHFSRHFGGPCRIAWRVIMIYSYDQVTNFTKTTGADIGIFVIIHVLGEMHTWGSRTDSNIHTYPFKSRAQEFLRFT